MADDAMQVDAAEQSPEPFLPLIGLSQASIAQHAEEIAGPDSSNEVGRIQKLLSRREREGESFGDFYWLALLSMAIFPADPASGKALWEVLSDADRAKVIIVSALPLL